MEIKQSPYTWWIHSEMLVKNTKGKHVRRPKNVSVVCLWLEVSYLLLVRLLQISVQQMFTAHTLLMGNYPHSQILLSVQHDWSLQSPGCHMVYVKRRMGQKKSTWTLAKEDFLHTENTLTPHLLVQCKDAVQLVHASFQCFTLYVENPGFGDVESLVGASPTLVIVPPQATSGNLFPTAPTSWHSPPG